MKMIGQNSPATPVPSTARPIGVGRQTRVREDRHERPECRRRERNSRATTTYVDARSLENAPQRQADASDMPQPDRPASKISRGT